MPLYRSKNKLIYFVHIPKTGGSSVENALKKANCTRAFMMSKAKNIATGYGMCTPQHMHAEVFQMYFPDDFIDYTFAVVRNPFDRIASEYKMKSAINGKVVAADVWINKALKRYKIYPYTRDNHIRPQHEFTGERAEVFRLEDGLTSPVKAACRALRLRRVPEIPHARQGASEKPIISEKTLMQIIQFYKADFSKFNYSIEDYGTAFEINS